MQEKYAKKQVSVATKLLVLLFVGLSGICLCYMNIDQRNSIRKSRRFLPSDNRENVVTCQLQTDHSIPTHYPQPTSYNRKECSCTPVHNFVILSMQRSGSGWFETLLNSHPNISSHGEVFLDEKKRKNFASIKKVLDAIYNLEWKSSASKKECTAAVGFKWMLNQAQILATFKPVVNVTLLPLYLRRVEELCHDAIVSFRSTRHKTVSYEDLVKNSLHVLEIQKFLGVIPKKLTSHHVKIHTEPLSKQIQNWKEVYHRLKGTEFDEFLHDY
ncbi:uncharacterized protein LOC131068727 isoform X3 [Cryptomeria japonica]|uniref:uncharacterized protein LOC131068727 isoform X3 n=1 Tax=Cryptomeria japonica TaxID=3369 RepID=UPI0025ABC96F|nr:uncharacterized protein LOC131068727 isoform X3 [Cryptomeria japonica]